MNELQEYIVAGNKLTKAIVSLVKRAKPISVYHHRAIRKAINAFQEIEKNPKLYGSAEGTKLLKTACNMAIGTHIVGDHEFHNSTPISVRRLAIIQHNGAKKYLLSCLSRQSCEDIDDVGMLAMYLQDYLDHDDIAINLAKNRLRAAYEGTNMDTASREEIPDSVWKFLMNLPVRG